MDSVIQEYDITPVAKPRMTQRDKWKGRPVVLNYFAFRDEVRLKKVFIPESNSHVTFVVPMPKKWSEKKKVEMDGKPHQQTPDVDNFCKGILDAVFEEDCRVWDIRATKLWGRKGKIIVRIG